MTVVESVPVAFARVLRGMGLDVPVASVLLYADALHAVGVERRDDVYWAGRAALVRRPEDIAAYDAAFAAFWLNAEPTLPSPPPTLSPPPPPPPATMTADEERGGAKASAHEVLRRKDFAAYTDEEFAEARRLMAKLRFAGRERTTRRLTPASATARTTLDLRRTVRRALATHGDPVRLATRRRATTPRRLVFFLDVSGSMDPYARALVRFVHAAVAARPHGKVDAFAVGTRVTRITRDLASRDPDAAVRQATNRVLDWAGGTRLGEGLQHLNAAQAGRGAHVVILSDGWERGDPAVLAEQLARLRRVAHRITWVNPHKATPGYEPLARGMAAALPYVDDFVEGHSIDSLDALARVLGNATR